MVNGSLLYVRRVCSISFRDSLRSIGAGGQGLTPSPQRCLGHPHHFYGDCDGSGASGATWSRRGYDGLEQIPYDEHLWAQYSSQLMIP
jgi:hypothetical protein